MHEYPFPKIRLKDGQLTKKIIWGITEPNLKTVDGQKNYRGAKSLLGVQKKIGEQKKEKKVPIENVGY